LYEASRLKFQLSWTRVPLGDTVADPTWRDVERQLSPVLLSSGSAQVDVVSDAETGPVCLQVFAESGRYILMLGVNTVDDYEILTPYDSDRSDEMVPILGDEWDNRSVTNDRSLVLSVFREFFDTGTVPPGTLV